MSRNGHSDIPGAPNWVKHLLGRIDGRFDTLSHQMHAHGSYVAALEKRLEQAEADIIELRRSITPIGMPAVDSEPPDEVA